MANIITYNNRLIDMDNAPYVAPTTTTLNEGLLAVYKAENNANDSLGNYNGTAQGGLTYTTGQSGNAFSLNGSNALVTLPNNMMSNQTFSYGAWVRYNNIPSGEAYIVTATNGNAGSINYGTAFGILSGQLILGIFDNNPGTAWRMSSGVLLANTWYHVAVTKTPGVAPKFYLNAVLQGTTLIVGTNNATLAYSGGIYTNSLCSIGAYRYNNNSTTYAYTNGRIDEVSIYNRELTQAEVTELQSKFYLYT
jgi:hypothetical protein